VTITIVLIPACSASKTASRVPAGGTVTVVLDDLLDRVEDRNAVDLTALAPWRHAADDLRAVVEALASQVDGLAAGDALDDERRVLVDQDAHR
jgi:hypothetical protein